MMTQADLDRMGAESQKSLRVDNWRVEYYFVKDLCTPAGDPVYALCDPEKDSKRAKILVRDPSTPPPNMSEEQWAIAMRAAVDHEVGHLLFAPFATCDPAAVTAEENAVWAWTGALEEARNVPDDCRLAIVARNISPQTRPNKRNGKTMAAKKADAGDLKAQLLEIIASGDEKKALEWIKAYAAQEMAEDEAPAPPAAEVPPEKKDENAAPAAKDPMMARMRAQQHTELADLTRSATLGRQSALRLAIATARTADGIALPPSVEKRILNAATTQEGESILETAREMAAVSTPRAGRSAAVQGGKEGDASKAGDTTGLGPHEVAAYEQLRASDPVSGAAYLSEAKRAHAKHARIAARDNAKKG